MSKFQPLPPKDIPPHGPIPDNGPRVIPAATVVIFRDGHSGGPAELLMVQRAKAMRFAGGAAVFPGGRVDSGDYALARQLAPEADNEIAAARIAGIRETLEETGLMIAATRPIAAGQAAQARAMLLDRGDLAPVLAHFGWQIDLEQLLPFAHWCPPFDGGFDTRFFVTDLGTGAVDITVDATENTRLFWTSAQDALRRSAEGEISLIFPTRRNLERLALFPDFAAACRQIALYPPRRIIPCSVEGGDGQRWLTIPEDAGYPVLGEPEATAFRG